jgi:A/G-specific adenine glycosylase
MSGKLRPFAERLLAWYDQHGRSDLPWQHPRTPYRVWISEVMLQQTQVKTVIPYFERWMQSFQDISSLAGSPVDDVLAHWSGLGYYARARNIHKTANICVQQHGGKLPSSPPELAALPGIGVSTANAIVSQSADQPMAVLDGNVKRLLARHTATEGWTGGSRVQKQLWSEAEDRLPANRGADYTQAVMDLGALVCTRSSPRCTDCPVSEDCQALYKGKVDQLPTPKPRTKVREKTVFMAVIRDQEGRVLLEKRPGAGIWGGLWCLPMADTADAITGSLGPDCRERNELKPVEHRLSHMKMTIHPILAVPGNASQVKCAGEHGWFDREQRALMGLPKPVSDLLGLLDKGELK